MANYVYIAVSLDGFIARKDGSLDWLPQEPVTGGFEFQELMARIDGIVMGRKTFDAVLSFDQWPYTKKVFVLSSTMAPAVTERFEILSGTPGDIVEKLRNRSVRNLYIDGGKTVQEFLKHGFVDELILTVVPVLLGEGISLFGPLASEVKLEHRSTEVLNGGLVQSWYRGLSR